MKTPHLVSVCLVALSLPVFQPRLSAQSAAALTTLYRFSNADNKGHNADGQFPQAGLVQGSDGTFYGTAFRGGVAGNGTVFQLTPAGVITPLHSFSATDAHGNNTDGTLPQAALVQGSDGNFYGTAQYGGANNGGTVFRITPAGNFTTLHSFSALSMPPQYGNGDGFGPQASLVQGSDGKLYGNTEYGGTDGAGAIFQITPEGVFTTLHSLGTANDGGQNDLGPARLQRWCRAATATFSAPLRTAAQGATAPCSSLRRREYLLPCTISPPAGAESIPRLPWSRAETAISTARASAGEAATMARSFGSPRPACSPSCTISARDPTITTTKTGRRSSPDSSRTMTGHSTAWHLMAGRAVPGRCSRSRRRAGSRPCTILRGYADGGTPLGSVVQGRDGYFYGTTDSGNGTIFKLAVRPVITSAATATQVQGHGFSYYIKATGSPVTYGVQGLPSFLHVNAATGEIYGTLDSAGTVNMTLNAYNSFGKGSTPLTLKITVPVPVVTSATADSAKVGSGYSYQITATNNPMSFGVQGLPAGLSVDAKTGWLSARQKRRVPSC